MRKFIFSFLVMFRFLSFTLSVHVLAAESSNQQTIATDNHTAQEEAEGKEIWEKLQAEELKCEDLSGDNFGALGEYFMGQMMGDSHKAMNNRLVQMLGEDGEEQMHIVMGKRLSGCDNSAHVPSNGVGFMPMMWMMGGENLMMGSFGTNPMGTFGWGFGWIFMILFWGLVILGIVTLVKWIANQGKEQNQSKSALDVLKERYAKGEIDKKEFEEKKKDLS